MGRRHSPFKKILIGFDGSSQSEKVTEIGLSLTPSLDSKVLLFAVARPPEPATMEAYWQSMQAWADSIIGELKQKFETYAESYRALCGAWLNIRNDDCLRSGNETYLDECWKWNADCRGFRLSR